MAWLAKLKEIVAEVAEIDDLSLVVDEARLFEDLGINSMKGLEIVLLVQEALDVQVPEKALYDLKTFGDIVRHVEAQLPGK